MPFKLIIYLFFFFTVKGALAAGSSAEGQVGYLYSPNLSNSLVQAGFFQFPIGDLAQVELGASFSERWVAAEIAEYKGEVRVPLFGFLEPFVRVSHHIGVSDNYSHSDFFTGARVHIPLFSWFEVYGVLGAYQKFFSQNFTFPFVFSPSVADEHLAALAGGQIRWSTTFRTSLDLLTFDRLRIFNLNNPALRLGLEWDVSPRFSWVASVRYKILLGFGRLDEILASFGVRYNL